MLPPQNETNAEELKRLKTKMDQYYYRVKIHALLSRSEEDIRRHGVISSGDKEIDKGMRDSWVITQMPISKMFQHYKNGSPVKVLSEKEAKEIYDIINEYVYAWKYRLEHGINIGQVPVDDLIEWDEFANIVYDKVKHITQAETVNSPLAMSMANTFALGKGHVFGLGSPLLNEPSPPPLANKEVEYAERDSLTEFFKKKSALVVNLNRK